MLVQVHSVFGSTRWHLDSRLFVMIMDCRLNEALEQVDTSLEEFILTTLKEHRWKDSAYFKELDWSFYNSIMTLIWSGQSKYVFGFVSFQVSVSVVWVAEPPPPVPGWVVALAVLAGLLLLALLIFIMYKVVNMSIVTVLVLLFSFFLSFCSFTLRRVFRRCSSVSD